MEESKGILGLQIAQSIVDDFASKEESSIRRLSVGEWLRFSRPALEATVSVSVERGSAFYTWQVQVTNAQGIVLEVIISSDPADSETEVFTYVPGEWENRLPFSPKPY